jgi:hypothetical protein
MNFLNTQEKTPKALALGAKPPEGTAVRETSIYHVHPAAATRFISRRCTPM